MRLLLGIGLAAAIAASACTPMRDVHGYVADDQDAAPLQAGIDTKSTVLARLGSPSTTAVFEDTVWYYVSATKETYAYNKPKTVQRKVTAIRFGQDDVVKAVENFGMEKGQVVAYNDKETPTRGRELGFIEQIFGTVGRLPSQNQTQDGPGGRGGGRN